MLEATLFLVLAAAFVWWQLRDIRKEREAARRRREAAPADASQGEDCAKDV
ncbi:MAG: hypothetical protein ACK5YW_17045 [Betaproteobacteria bacterium]|jgi:hypothetical protein|nr:hypothetical protein [Rhodocyclaceae bacterium]MCA3133143.1 hypothetical protein [Rhodocyclaceae bacterium]MCA3141778.1 hypothetical protein [Rhodocyclaceae bacterium]MCA3144686.1 hypothetical protein [Rhodocyclaceae bacterium]MCE2896734.1 hypothetical protein [Betaproteobacteria bacterium]